MGRVVADYTELARLLADQHAERTLALTNGCFDLLHVGHVRLLQAAAQAAELLVVGLNVDEVVRASKGADRPLVPLAERMEVIAALAGVDFVTSFPEPTADRMIRCLQPQVYVKGTDWSANTVPERESVLAVGGRVLIAGDEKTHSSSDLVRRAGEPG